MLLSSASGTWGELRQSNSHRRALADFADDLDFAAVQVDTALYDYETQTRTWTLIDVMPAMEGAKEPLAIGFRNSNAPIPDRVNNISVDRRDFEAHQASSFRIFNGIREQIREYVS